MLGLDYQGRVKTSFMSDGPIPMSRNASHARPTDGREDRARRARRRQWWGWLLLALFPLSLLYRYASSRQPSVNYDGIILRGTPPFIDDVRASLDLLKERDPEAFSMMQEHTRRIVLGRLSTLVPNPEGDAIVLDGPTSSFSTTWCAAMIVELALQGKDLHEMTIEASPNNAGIQNPERMRILKRLQSVISTGKRIQMPRFEIRYLQSLTGLEFDEDGDGRWTWEDYFIKMRKARERRQ